MKRTITVTREDLKGEYADIFDCPIARAVKREFKQEYVKVGPETIYIENMPISLPEKANRKALSRSEHPILGWILGGFKFEIEI